MKTHANEQLTFLKFQKNIFKTRDDRYSGVQLVKNFSIIIAFGLKCETDKFIAVLSALLNKRFQNLQLRSIKTPLAKREADSLGKGSKGTKGFKGTKAKIGNHIGLKSQRLDESLRGGIADGNFFRLLQIPLEQGLSPDTLQLKGVGMELKRLAGLGDHSQLPPPEEDGFQTTVDEDSPTADDDLIYL